MSALGLLLAHQGGWDEALFVLAPLLLFAGLLMVARKRVDQMESEDDADRGIDDAAAFGGGRLDTPSHTDGPEDTDADDNDTDEEHAGGR
ncbi:MAG: hypothetical protein U5K30_03065 [Acidimicrobiales bacterium]|nr:hypothetical protein [Acidimicrobiales bacterium]